MKRRMTTKALSLALQVHEGVIAALWLLIGVSAVRALIGLAKMVPMSPSAEPQCGPSQNADENPQARAQRTSPS
jgi:hypothetical protein